MHKSFKPKMTGGIDQSSVGLSPEAHKEWNAKGGKHVINGAHKKAAAPPAPSAKAKPSGGKKLAQAPAAAPAAKPSLKGAAPMGLKPGAGK